MNVDLIMIVGLAAVFIMLINLFQVISLRSHVGGGMVGKSWNIMTLLVVMFAAGYSILLFLATIPVETGCASSSPSSCSLARSMC